MRVWILAVLLILGVACPVLAAPLPPLQRAQRELELFRFYEAAELAREVRGFSARVVEVEALTESERLGEAWVKLRAMPPVARKQPMFYVLRGELNGFKGDVDSLDKDFAEALELSGEGASRVLLLARYSIALSRCKRPEAARRRWLEALAASGGRSLSRPEFAALHWAQVWLAVNSTEPTQGLAALAALEDHYRGNPGGLARVSLWKAFLCFGAGDFPRARVHLDTSFKLCLGQPNRAGLVGALGGAATWVHFQDRQADRDWIRHLFLQASRTGYPEVCLGSYQGLAALAAHGDGDLKAARAWLEESWLRFPQPRFRIVTLTTSIRLHKRWGGEPEDRIPWLMERWRLLSQAGPWRQPEDPYHRYTRSEVYYCELAECHLRRDPARALALYQQARQAAPSDAARLEALESQLLTGARASAMAVMHEALSSALQLFDATREPQRRLNILESLVKVAATSTRLREMWDESLLPRAESTLGVLRQAVVSRRADLHQLELRYQQEIDQAISLSRLSNATSSCRRLANLLLIQERFQEAIWVMDRGIALAQQAHWPDREASLRELRARLCRALGRPQEALAELELACGLYRQISDQDSLADGVYARALFSLILRREGRAQEALSSLGEALRANRAGPEEKMFVFLQASRALSDLGRRPEALQRAHQALELCQDSLTRIALETHLAGLELQEGHTVPALEALRRAWSQALQRHSLSVRETSLQLGRLLEQQGQAEEARQVYLQTADMLDVVARENPPETRAALARHPTTIALREKLSSVGWKGWDWFDLAAAVVTPAEAGERSRFLQDCNDARSTVNAWDAQLPVPVGDFANLHLPEGHMVVQFLLTPHETHLLVVGAHTLRLHRLRIEQDVVKRWLGQAWSSQAEGRLARQNLYRLLIKPWLREGSVPLRVGLLPTAELWYLPWASLQDDQGRFLCRQAQLSLRSVEDLRAGEEWRLDPSRWLLAGGVDANLPETLREVESLHKLFPQAATLTGERATRANFLDACQGASLVHLASHSAVVAGDLNRSSIELVDGMLPLSQLYQVKLAPGALVVMSSCRGAVGEEAPGKEVGSLANAWRAAGAGQVLATLRPVDDEAARAFCELFYGHLGQGLTPAESLRRTQDELSRTRGEETLLKWASFVLFGSN